MQKKGWDKKRQDLFVLVHHSVQMPESIEWFIEDQAFSPSYDLAPPATPLPSSVSKLSLFLRLLCVAGREGKGGGGGAKSYGGQKAWSSVNHSILSDRSPAAILWNGRCKYDDIYVPRTNPLWPHLSQIRYTKINEGFLMQHHGVTSDRYKACKTT